MRKMPPLPIKKTAGNKTIQDIKIVSNKLKMPQRYNSIERVIR
jgi:hypothetical protein